MRWRLGKLLPLAESALHEILKEALVLRISRVRSDAFDALKVFDKLSPPSERRCVLPWLKCKAVKGFDGGCL